MLGVPLMPLKKLLKYRLNLNWLEDRTVTCYCHADYDAINILCERSCHYSDMKMMLASQYASRNVKKCHLCHSKSYCLLSPLEKCLELGALNAASLTVSPPFTYAFCFQNY